jgi:hypothetical protein
VRALLREERVGDGFSDDDDGVSDLDVKVRGITAVSFEPLMKLLQPVSLHAEGVLSTSTAATQLRQAQTDSTPASPATRASSDATPQAVLTDAASAVLAAFRSACGSDPSKSAVSSVC